MAVSKLPKKAVSKLNEMAISDFKVGKRNIKWMFYNRNVLQFQQRAICLNEKITQCWAKWVNKQMSERMNEWMNEWMNELFNEWII